MNKSVNVFVKHRAHTPARRTGRTRCSTASRTRTRARPSSGRPRISRLVWRDLESRLYFKGGGRDGARPSSGRPRISRRDLDNRYTNYIYFARYKSHQTHPVHPRERRPSGRPRRARLVRRGLGCGLVFKGDGRDGAQRSSGRREENQARPIKGCWRACGAIGSPDPAALLQRLHTPVHTRRCCWTTRS
jgi:hypothetical protein